MSPGDVVIGVLTGAVETKLRPAVVISSNRYIAEHPDALVGIVTTKLPRPVTALTALLSIGNPPDFAPSLGSEPTS